METTKQISASVSKALMHLHRDELPAILRIQGGIMRSIHEFMESKGVIHVNPLMTSPITDPLSHDVTEADFVYADQKFSLMKSMILHKQLLLSHPHIDSIYIVSPNVRLEGPERKDTGRHLFEFTQVDYEFKEKTMDFVITFTEEMVAYIFSRLNAKYSGLVILFRGELLKVPETGWPRYSTHELIKKYGDSWEKESSLAAEGPFWVTDHDREFYDREDERNKGHFLNYDIMWPEGYMEGLSGAEREDEYEQIIYRMKRSGTDPEKYKQYLDVAEAGIIPRTAGAGIGIERLTRFITRRKDINEVSPFSRKPYDTILF
jgi:asparaginyl-tRNA synthetase